MSQYSKTPLLDQIKYPSDLRKLPPDQLRQAADELRTETIDAVSVTGGHLGAGLGVVELTVALHYVFDTPKDRIIWDVGHQAYPHKILTGRRDRIRTLRMGKGLSGFTKRAESEYDPFGAAHSSTSISAGLGMAVARDLAGGDNNVIAVIGDGSMSAGMAYEAMNNAGAMNSRLIVILNDNDMSIAPPVGAMSAYLSRLLSNRTFMKLRDIGLHLAHKFPKLVEQKALQVDEYARGFLTGGTLFEELGFYYVGPIDGHNLDHLLPVLKNVRDAKQGPILVHVVTQKGKGYEPAEKSADKYHGVVKFDVVSGVQQKAKSNAPSYQTVFGQSLIKEAQKDPKIVAIFVLGTALMRSAGCAINDYADQDFDRHVKRTAQRPVTRGAIGTAVISTGLLKTDEAEAYTPETVGAGRRKTAVNLKVNGKSYREILQRIMNTVAWGQIDSGCNGQGGWTYNLYNNGCTTADGSTIGWNMMALLDAGAAGVTIPAFVKASFVATALPNATNTDGTFDYQTDSNPASDYGPNLAKSGIGMQGQFYAGTLVGDAKITSALGAINARWPAINAALFIARVPGCHHSQVVSRYADVALSKPLRSQTVNEVVDSVLGS